MIERFMQMAAFVVFASNPRRVRRVFEKEWVLWTTLFLALAFVIYIALKH